MAVSCRDDRILFYDNTHLPTVDRKPRDLGVSGRPTGRSTLRRVHLTSAFALRPSQNGGVLKERLEWFAGNDSCVCTQILPHPFPGGFLGHLSNCGRPGGPERRHADVYEDVAGIDQTELVALRRCSRPPCLAQTLPVRATKTACFAVPLESEKNNAAAYSQREEDQRLSQCSSAIEFS